MERVFEPTGAGKVIVEADLASLHRALAQGIAVEANLAIRKRGVFRIALAGGQTPRAAYELLAQNAVEPSIDWSSRGVLQ
jgi:6-phosphogluconolactonase